MNSHEENSVSLLVEEWGGRNRCNEPVTFGIPFPRGKIADPRCLVLYDASGRQRPLQVKTLSHWADGSAKWTLLDFQADIRPNSQTVYQLRSNGTQSAELQSPSLSVQASSDHIVVDSGKATFFLNRQVCKPFDRVVAGGNELLVSEGSFFRLTDKSGEEYLPYIRELLIETAGPLRVTVRAVGELKRTSQKALACFVVRLSFFGESNFVQMQITLHNPQAAHHAGGRWDLGDKGSIYFKDCSLRVPLRMQAAPRIAWTANHLHPLNNSLASDLQIYQDSSGGENWRSTNHVNRFGQVMQSFRGYRVSAKDCLLEEGFRATPIVALYGENGSVIATIDKFWQNFPKALEAHDNELILRLFPRQFNDIFELQGGEQKTHTIYLQFCAPGHERLDLGWVHDRLVPRATPEWYSNSGACSYLSPLSQDPNAESRELIDGAISGPRSFFARREIIDEYGWRHFGDLYADHEAVGHTADTSLISHYNNQYDVIYGAIVQYLRTGDRRCFELMADLARHVIDIDIYHTAEDRPAYNGGLFWHTDHYLDAGTATHRTYSKASLKLKDRRFYGGGPSNEHNYTSGLLHYYYLTGDETARLAILSLADWVMGMDDGSKRPLGFLDRRPTGLASSTASRDYHGPGRGAGNSINALLDAYVVNRKEPYFIKAEQLIRRCIHPKDDIASRELNEPEHRWSYLVFLQVLGKYLDYKIEQNQMDFMYGYAQASLLHYAEWMLEHEVPYATVLDKVEIPTETWPAQDIRKSVVFHLAAQHARESLRTAFRKKAAYFFQACIRDLLTFPTHKLTRPAVLILTNAYVHAYFEGYDKEQAPQPSQPHEFGHPHQFSPQFAELYQARETLSVWVAMVLQCGRAILSLVEKKSFPWSLTSR
jgi:hypothetical protein